MAEFSADRTPEHVPAFHGRGQFAQHLGAEAAKPRGAPGRKPGLGRSAPPKQDSQQGPGVGRIAPREDPNQEQDLSHLGLALQHFNMKGLGRDIPYVVWATLTGNYRQYAQPGRPPFDYLED
jgi:hypothetical protein